MSVDSDSGPRLAGARVAGISMTMETRTARTTAATATTGSSTHCPTRHRHLDVPPVTLGQLPAGHRTATRIMGVTPGELSSRNPASCTADTALLCDLDLGQQSPDSPVTLTQTPRPPHEALVNDASAACVWIAASTAAGFSDQISGLCRITACHAPRRLPLGFLYVV